MPSFSECRSAAFWCRLRRGEHQFVTYIAQDMQASPENGDLKPILPLKAERAA